MQPLKFLFPTWQKEILIHAYIFSSLNYMCLIWLQPINFKKYDKIVKRAARFVFGADQFSSVTNDVCNNLDWLFASQKLLYEICKFAYTSNYRVCPKPFLHYIDLKNCKEIVTRKGTTLTPLSFPKTKFGKQGLYHKSLINWCAIPEEIRNIDIFPIFCNKLLQLCHENQKKYLCTDLCNVCDYSCMYRERCYKLLLRLFFSFFIHLITYLLKSITLIVSLYVFS